MVWQRIPKEVYVGREILEMGLYDAVAHFNMGTSAVLKLFYALGIPPVFFREVCVYILACNELQIASLVQMALKIKILKFEVYVNFGFSGK